MNEIFRDIPIESDTEIVFEQVMKFGDFDVLYQMWLYDGIQGESIVLKTADVSLLSDTELLEFISSSDIVKDKKSLTLSRGDKYIFVNFNFIEMD